MRQETNRKIVKKKKEKSHEDELPSEAVFPYPLYGRKMRLCILINREKQHCSVGQVKGVRPR